MYRGLLLSVVIHSVVLAAAVFTWPQARSACDKLFEQARAEEPGLDNVDLAIRYPECAAELDVPIEIVDISDVTNVSAVVRPKNPPKEEPEEQKLEEQPEETEDDPALEEDPSDEEVIEEPAPEEVVEEAVPDETEASDELEEDKEADAAKEEELLKKTAEEEAQNELDALLNDFTPTLENKQTDRAKAPPKSTDIQTPVLTDEVQPRKAIGEKTSNTASLQASMRRQIGYCWRSVDDLPEPDRLNVTVQMSLDRDGNISSPAKLVNPARRPIGDRFMGVAIDRALVAVRKCAPYKLPPDDYDEWKDIIIRIGPID